MREMCATSKLESHRHPVERTSIALDLRRVLQALTKLTYVMEPDHVIAMRLLLALAHCSLQYEHSNAPEINLLRENCCSLIPEILITSRNRAPITRSDLLIRSPTIIRHA